MKMKILIPNYCNFICAFVGPSRSMTIFQAPYQKQKQYQVPNRLEVGREKCNEVANCQVLPSMTYFGRVV